MRSLGSASHVQRTWGIFGHFSEDAVETTQKSLVNLGESMATQRKNHFLQEHAVSKEVFAMGTSKTQKTYLRLPKGGASSCPMDQTHQSHKTCAVPHEVSPWHP